MNFNNLENAVFTFHYVSIKSAEQVGARPCRIQFTFHYVSIKSTAYTPNTDIVLKFTFHYVSIKSSPSRITAEKIRHLHSTMYLLNRLYLSNNFSMHPKFTFHYVSIKSEEGGERLTSFSKFTFHYVSIKSTAYNTNVCAF